MIRTESYVSNEDHQAYVRFLWGEEKGKLTPKEARDFALTILEAADAAESDAFIVNFMTEQVKADAVAAVKILREFREFREAARNKPEEGSEN